MAIEAKDGLDDSDNTPTVIIIAGVQGSMPGLRQTIYFEILEALGHLQKLNADVHLYLFDPLPFSPTQAVSQLHSAKGAFQVHNERHAQATCRQRDRGGVAYRQSDESHSETSPVALQGQRGRLACNRFAST